MSIFKDNESNLSNFLISKKVETIIFNLTIKKEIL